MSVKCLAKYLRNRCHRYSAVKKLFCNTGHRGKAKYKAGQHPSLRTNVPIKSNFEMSYERTEGGFNQCTLQILGTDKYRLR